MAVVRIAGALRQFAEAGPTLPIPGSSVAEVLRNLGSLFPAIKPRLYGGDGEPGSHFLLYKDGRLVKPSSFAETAVEDASVIAIHPILAGG